MSYLVLVQGTTLIIVRGTTPVTLQNTALLPFEVIQMHNNKA